MIDIYDEVGYVKEILEHGFSERWERDALLLARYYKSIGMKKSEAKTNVKEKAERYSKNYQKYKDYARANKIVDTAYKKETPLRKIQQIKIPKTTIKWFFDLETKYKINNEKIEELKNGRKGLKIDNKPMNFNRVKFLFTLYVWTRVQEDYLDKPYMHYLDNYMKRFKHDADLPSGFSVNKEKNLLHDLGFIYINFAQGIDCTFIKENEQVWCGCKEWVKDFRPEWKQWESDVLENYYILQGEDLYNPGYWLQKQKFGSFTCQRCSKEFAHYNDTKQEKGRKYCKECYIALKNEKGLEENKEIKCIDCNKIIIINIKDNKTKRCEKCQKEYRKKYLKEYKDRKNIAELNNPAS